MIDFSTEFGARVHQRLQQEELIWLTTVRADGTPQPSPVWFYWDGQTLLIYSQPNKPKLRNIAQNPTVALNFNSDADGGDIVVITGQARIEENGPAATDVTPYLEKYRDAIQGIDMTPEAMAQSYSVVIRITPTSVRGF